MGIGLLCLKTECHLQYSCQLDNINTLWMDIVKMNTTPETCHSQPTRKAVIKSPRMKVCRYHMYASEDAFVGESSIRELSHILIASQFYFESVFGPDHKKLLV